MNQFHYLFCLDASLEQFQQVVFDGASSERNQYDKRARDQGEKVPADGAVRCLCL
jgi:hypothetical protein